MTKSDVIKCGDNLEVPSEDVQTLVWTVFQLSQGVRRLKQSMGQDEIDPNIDRWDLTELEEIKNRV